MHEGHARGTGTQGSLRTAALNRWKAPECTNKSFSGIIFFPQQQTFRSSQGDQLQFM